MRHVGARALDLETTVADEPAATRPLVSRTRTDGALTMQVLQEGHWHRRTPDLATTSCGAPISSQFSPLRREALTDPLCLVCFTDYERAKAAEQTRLDLEGT